MTTNESPFAATLTDAGYTVRSVEQNRQLTRIHLDAEAADADNIRRVINDAHDEVIQIRVTTESDDASDTIRTVVSVRSR